MNEKLARKFSDGLELRGYAQQTKKGYFDRIRRLSRHFNRSPERITEEELRQYFLYLLRDRKLSRSTLVGVSAALRAFYRIVCGRPTDSLRESLPIMKVRVPLPRLYSKEEIERLLSADSMMLKQRTMLTTMYASGVRVGELCQLRVADIITARMQIRIRQGKGGRERHTVLSPKLLKILRYYWRAYRPQTWLFPSPYNEERPLCTVTLYRAFAQAVKAAGLPERGGIHSLRHSFATHMYESGVSLPALQNLLGHSCLASTMVYLHVSQLRLDEARSPFDQINISPELYASGTETGPPDSQAADGEITWDNEP